MGLSYRDKIDVLSFIKEKFDWCSLEAVKEKNFASLFYDHDMEVLGFECFYGCSKFCIYHPFFGDYVVKFSTESFDYCEREYKNYWAAVYNHFEEYFPYTIFLGNLNGINLYLQEKAICDSQAVSDMWYSKVYDGYWSEEEAIEASNTGEIWNIIDDLDDSERIEIIYDNSDLIDFLDEYRINDLHEGNFGYIGERLVIIDFSGYRSF